MSKNIMLKSFIFFSMLVITCFIFNGIFNGKVITNNFYLFAHEPWAHHIIPGLGNYNYMLSDDMDAMSVGFPTNRILQGGEIPYWNHFWQLGMPEFRIDSGWFYPLRWLWIVFGIPIGMTLEVLLRHTLAAIFTFLLLTRLKVTPFVSIIAAIGYSFGSTAIGDYMFGFGPPALALPIVTYFVEKLIQENRARDVIYVCLSWIYMNTHIMIHVNVLCCAWIAFYALIRIAFENNRLLRYWRLCLSIISGMLIFSFAILPTLDFYTNYFNDSYRQGYSEQQLHLASLLTLFFNSFFGDPLLEKSRYFYGSFTGSAVFVGFLTGLGLAPAVVRLFQLKDKIIISASITTLLLMLTTYKFPYERSEFFMQYLPFFKLVPGYYQRPAFQFFLMIIGALGLDFFVKNWRDKKRGALIILSTSAVFLLSLVFYLINYHYVGPSLPSWNYFVITSTLHLLSFLFFLLFAYFKTRSSGWTIATGIIIISLASYESMINAKGWIPYSTLSAWYPSTQTTDFLKDHLPPGDRVISLDTFAVPGLLFGYNIPIAAGRALPQKDYLEMLRLANPNLHKDHPTQSFFALKDTDLNHPVWNLINVNYFVASKEVDKVYLEENYGETILPHYLVDGVILERKEKSKPYTVSGCADEGSVLDYVIKTNSIEAKIAIKNLCPVYLTPSIAYNHGWTAFVGDRTTEIRKTYGFLPTITLNEPGVHAVRFTFFPRYLKLGLYLSVVGLALLAVGLYPYRQQNKKV